MLATLFAAVLALQAVAVRADDWNDEGLSLVQAAVKVERLPEVKKVMEGTKTVFAKLTGEVGSLTQKLQQEQNKAKKTTEAMKSAFETNLTAETKENSAIESKNEKLQKEVDKLNSENKDMRSDATALRQRNRDLVADLHVMQNNVTTVIEFTSDVLNQSHNMLEGDSRLYVLNELSKKDEESAKVRKHKQRLARVAHADLSLLQMDTPKEFTKEEDPHGLLQMMDAALEQLETEENASKTNLTKAFDRDFQVLMSARVELLEKQEELKTGIENALLLKDKLKSALKHLEASNKKLSSQAGSLRSFSKKLSAKPLPKAVALLQTSAQTNGKKALPNVGKVLSKPKAIFTTMNKHVSSLESRLAEVQHQNMQTIGIQKREYEANLTKQKEHHHKIEHANANLKLDVDHLQHSIDRLRASAKDLEIKNAHLVVDVQRVQTNITTAQEFTKDALNSSEVMLYKAPELEVLTELANKEQIMSSQRDHNNRLHEVGGSNAVSLLQVSKGQDPHNLLELMTSALAELSEEQNASEYALKESFLAEYNEGAEKTAALLTKQDELNQTKYAAIELQDKLVIAVEHLQSTHRQLKERSESLHSFALRLGSKKLPTAKGLSLLQEEDGVSLLQLSSATAKVSGVDVKAALERPKMIFRGMTSNVSALGSSLNAAHEKATEELMDQQEDYEAQIAEAKLNNTKLEAHNHVINKSINALKQHVRELRVEAKDLNKQNDLMKKDLVSIQANISLAQEFLAKSLERTNETDTESEDLLVLHELEEKDRADENELFHQHSLAKVAASNSHIKSVKTTKSKDTKSKSAKISLLQMSRGIVRKRPSSSSSKSKKDAKGMSEDGKTGAKSLLTSLGSALQSLIEEQEASAVLLRNEFDIEMAEQVNLTSGFVKTQVELNETENATKALEARLETAVVHLKKTQNTLKKRREGMKKFAQKLAARPNPVNSFNLVEVATIEAKPTKSHTQVTQQGSSDGSSDKVEDAGSLGQSVAWLKDTVTSAWGSFWG